MLIGKLNATSTSTRCKANKPQIILYYIIIALSPIALSTHVDYRAPLPRYAAMGQRKGAVNF